MKRYPIFLFFSTVLFVRCTVPDCIDQGGESIGITFRDEETGALEPLRVNLLQVAGAADTLFFNEEAISSLSLFIDPTALELTAYFDTELGNDTLTIGYNRTVRLISEECGVEIIYEGINIIRNDFDSSQVVNSKVQVSFLNEDDTGENIRIFN